MDNLVIFASRESVERAWNRFQAHTALSKLDQDLLSNRGYINEWALLERTYKRLYLASLEEAL